MHELASQVYRSLRLSRSYEAHKILEDLPTKGNCYHKLLTMDISSPPPPYTAHDPHPRLLNPASLLTSTTIESGSRSPLTESLADGRSSDNHLEREREGKAGNKEGSRKSRDTSLGPALNEAVSKRDTQTVRMLLQNNAYTNVRSWGGKTALNKAVSNNDLQIVQLLLEEGQPDIEACPPGGKTALYSAVTNGYTDIVRLLLKHGADVNFKPSGGKPAIYKAYTDNYREIMWMLLDSENVKLDETPPGGSTTLYQAAEKGDKEVVQALLSDRAAVDIKPPGGVSAMHRAAVRGDIGMTEMLLQSGAKVDVTPPGGTTALWHATKKGNLDLVRLLLRYGADLNAKPPGGQDVLTQAVKSDKSPDRVILNLLLQTKKERQSG